MAAVHKVAAIAYAAFGEEYEGRMEAAEAKYGEAIDGTISQGLDVDEDGHEDEYEHQGNSRGIFRR